MHSAEERFNTAAGRLGRANSIHPADTVDLSTETVNLLTAKQQFETSLQTVRAADEVTKSTLDLFA
jgi:flagellar hook protein FlgE